MKNLGFGLMRLPLINNEFSHVDKKMLCDMVDLYLDKGFQYFDTAWFYHDGQSELSIKDCLVDRYPRSAFLLANKMPLILIQEERELEEYFSAQLKRCGVDFFDYYLIHDMGGNRRKLAEDMHVFDFFVQKKEAGLVKHIGFSFHDTADVLFAAGSHTGKTELSNNVNRLRLKTDHDYYNSGVLLIDLKRCREQITPETLFQYVRTHENELLLPDQDVLNALYGKQVLPINDALWNYDARNYQTYLLRSGGARDLSWVMANTSILHFCGKVKPWKLGYPYRFGLLYRHYMQIMQRWMEQTAH